MLTASRSSIAARLENLPIGKFHYRFISLVSLGEWFDMYDLFMVAYIGAALQNSGFLSLHQFTQFVAAGFLGMFVGTVLFGISSDEVGRRTSFVAMLLVYSAFTLVGSLAPSATWLVVCRFLAGIGIGAEIVVIDAYVSEMVPSSARGRFVAITQVIGFTSVPTVAVLSRILVPRHFLFSGWRWVMVIGAAGALLAWHLRLGLPESPRWLESRGQIAEAERIVRQIEKQSGVRATAPEARPGSSSAQTAQFAELWRPPYRSRTLMLMAFQ